MRTRITPKTGTFHAVEAIYEKSVVKTDHNKFKHIISFVTALNMLSFTAKNLFRVNKF